MRKIHLLLVEDNEGDILLTKEALQESEIISKVDVLKDGAAAIQFLKSLNASDSHPDLILLDINLPKKSGHEVLQFIKSSDTLRQIPVIMLTTSSSESDILLSYKNYANCYITKPIDVADFMEAIQKMENFWATIATVPSGHSDELD